VFSGRKKPASQQHRGNDRSAQAYGDTFCTAFLPASTKAATPTLEKSGK
jgi:hypothetical protein